jgi:hypothetical protein
MKTNECDGIMCVLENMKIKKRVESCHQTFEEKKDSINLSTLNGHIYPGI